MTAAPPGPPRGPLPHRPRLEQVPLPRGPLALWCPAGAEALLDELAGLPPDPDDRMPYWADLWPSAVALAHAIDGGAIAVGDRSALELGCGLGLVSLAAARAGARVTASDWDPDALAYVEASAAEGGLELETALLDWRAPPARSFEVILAADVVYEARNAPLIAGALERLLAPGGVAWLADPGRRFLPDLLGALSRWKVGAVRVEATGPHVPRGRVDVDLYRLER